MDLLHSLEQSFIEFKKAVTRIYLGESKTNESFNDYAHFLYQSHNIRQSLCFLEASAIDLLKTKCSPNERVNFGFGDAHSVSLCPKSSLSDRNSLSNETLDTTQYENSLQYFHHCSESTTTEEKGAGVAKQTETRTFNFFEKTSPVCLPKREDFYLIDELPTDAILDEPNQSALVAEWAEFPMQLVTKFSEMPLQSAIENGDEFEAYMIYVISPLEFYVLKKDDFWSRTTLESVLINDKEALMCEERRIPFPGPGEDFSPDMPCLAWVNDRLNRALIRFSGFEDVQVFLIDYGTSHLVLPDAIFYMPHGIATFVPGLAMFCTLEDADSRMLDTAVWRNFLENFSDDVEVTVRGFGVKRRSHGYLVQIIDSDTGIPFNFGSKSKSWREMRKARLENQRAISVSPPGSTKSSRFEALTMDDTVDEEDSDSSDTVETASELTMLAPLSTT